VFVKTVEVILSEFVCVRKTLDAAVHVASVSQIS
jgi:hypothetical protein